MRRMFAICSAWSLVALAVAHAAPARPLYEPEMPPQLVLPKAVVLAGTAWLGKYNTLNRTYFFEEDGTISYRSSASKLAKGIKNRGAWKLDGDKIYFEHHMGGAKVLEFRGVLKDSNTIVGEQIMVNTGVKTAVTMQRAPLDIK